MSNNDHTPVRPLPIVPAEEALPAMLRLQNRLLSTCENAAKVRREMGKREDANVKGGA